ncbi:MAG: PAS domain-containing protein [Phycisphaerae bacterium]|nr:PAS domain-containing protein [Phycisphaerae bacterium]
MKKELLIWKILGAGYLTAAVIALAGGLGLLPAGVILASIAGLFLCGVFFGYVVRRHLKKLKSISLSLSSQALIIPADFRGTLLEEITFSIRDFLSRSQDQLARVQEENQGLSLQLQLLRRRKSNVEEIINSIYDAVVVTDERERIILANEATEQLFGFMFENDKPKIITEVIQERGLIDLMTKTRQSKTAHVRHELTFQRQGQPVSFDTVLSCVEDDAGNVIQVVAVLHDITREKEIAQMKNDFVSHVSHELKTPLASINAYAEMLVDGEAQDTETIQQFCGIIQGQAQRLGRLIEDILNISRIESGLIKVKKETHSLALVIRDAVEMIKSYAQEKNIQIESPASILYDQVYVDRDMISQVVINLLSNAVKYMPAGGRIKVSSELDEVEGQVKITITDTGVGIPPEDVEHVFDKFYRVQANNQYAKGTGLGLNLVKQIVETVHEGNVFVTSTVGKGSTFGFVLPLAAERIAQSV